MLPSFYRNAETAALRDTAQLLLLAASWVSATGDVRLAQRLI
jgi:hypothetical protein